MKKIIILFTLVIITSGCATVASITMPNRAHLTELSVGINKADALQMMRNKTMIVKLDPLHSVIINNPYRSEILQGKDKTFEVYYYVTGNEYDDNIIRDGDLTPLVFEEGKLIGWGKNFVSGLIEKNEIKTTNNAKTSKSKAGSFGFGGKKKKNK